MEELSGLDASFLYLETPKIPMHIGGVAVMEGSLTFDDFSTICKRTCAYCRQTYPKIW